MNISSKHEHLNDIEMKWVVRKKNISRESLFRAEHRSKHFPTHGAARHALRLCKNTTMTHNQPTTIVVGFKPLSNNPRLSFIPRSTSQSSLSRDSLCSSSNDDEFLQSSSEIEPVSGEVTPKRTSLDCPNAGEGRPGAAVSSPIVLAKRNKKDYYNYVKYINRCWI